MSTFVRLNHFSSNIHTNTKMSKTQKTITNFFKRKVIDDDESNCKKPCTDVGGDKLVLRPQHDNLKIVQSNNNSRRVASGYISAKWYQSFEQEFHKSYFKNLEKFITNERNSHTIYPPENQVFSWSFHCDIDNVKVIILGQDPYHGPKQANGLAFSVERDVAKPPSLINIFKEIKNEYPEFIIPAHGDLKQWSSQGVLLLNASLTVRANQANSHSNHGWEQFTDSIIKYLNQNYSNRVFMLWGNYAQKKGAVIDSKKHLVLKSVHPSPLSVMRGFFGCGHFKQANDYLIKHGIKPIDWTKLD
ncbi:uracil-DNA glycosylase-like [Dermatophagoides farinae]|uniref:uracil-DNA glycosylase-like n=1 Tax=Dermatophagoides farinae TaxID=6954 RepID=UPI003F622D66